MFEAIPLLECDQTANLVAGMGRALHPHLPDADAESILELEINQTGVENLSCASGTCGGARVGVDRPLAWCGEWCGLPIPDCRYCAFST